MTVHRSHRCLLVHVGLILPWLHISTSAPSAVTRAISWRPEVDPTCFTEGPEGLFEWVESRGGFIDPRLELSNGPNAISSVRGMFAKADIKKDEVLVVIPWELIITGNTSLEGSDYQCSKIQRIAEELRLGRCSRLWPYIKVMSEHQIALPNAWPEEDLALVSDLPPYDWTRHTNWYTKECKGKLDDLLGLRALLLMVARADGWGLTPVYDTFNHRDGLWTNVVTGWQENVEATMRASKDIQAGSQLYNYYGVDGAPGTFRDYGFVEQEPAVWYFDSDGKRFSFTVLSDVGDIQWPSLENMRADEHYEAFARDAKKLLSKLLLPPDGESLSDSPYANMALSYREAFAQALQWALTDVASRGVKAEL